MKQLQFVLALLLVAPLFAQQQYQSLEKGFQAEKVYQFGEIDNVNIFNGNLIITIPIGLSYPLNGELSYNLVLSYNSTAYDLDDSAPTGIRAIPTMRSNAGLGWTIGMGRFVAYDDPMNFSDVDLYEAPDGGDHRFVDTRGTCADPCPTKYTRNEGSVLRLRSTEGSRDVDSPDGVVRHFEKNLQGKWVLRTITGPRSTQSVTVGYFTTASECPGATSSWRISDSAGRFHWVCFKTYPVDGVDRPMVDRVVVSSAATSVYQFTYDTWRTLIKPIEDTDFSSNWMQSHTAPLLTSLTLLDGSKHTFDYDQHGRLNKMVLPTGGKYAYTYGSYSIPSLDFCANNYGLGYGFGGHTTGVIKRELTSAVPSGQSAQTRTWSYTPRLYPLGSPAGYLSVKNCTPPTVGEPQREPTWVDLFDEMIVWVKDDTQRIVANHFSLWPGNDDGRSPDEDTSPAGFHRFHHGWPYGPKDTAQNRHLSQEIFACTAASCSQPTTVTCDGDPSPCTPLRSVYVRHEADGVPLGNYDDPTTIPHRLVSQRTVFRDDSDKWTQSDWSDWDSYGHYRTAVSSREFSNATSTRTEQTSWNKINGVVRTIGSGENWILNTYEDVKVTEGSDSRIEQACFDTTTGFLRGRRTLLGASPGNTDLLAVFAKNTDGNLASESYYGGDNDSGHLREELQVSPLCTALNTLAALSVTPEYKINHTWQNGRMATSQYEGASFKSLDLTIDLASGLVSKSRDVAGLETSYSYDQSGRLTFVDPPGTIAGTAYAYFKAVFSGTVLTTPANVQELRSSTTGTVRRDYQYDSFGRLWREKRLLGDTYALRETLYDSLDRRKSVSVWTTLPEGNEYAFVPSKKTTYTYDVFDRPLSITAPDTKATTFAYAGVRTTTRTSSVAMAGGDTNVSTIETYDPRGRLMSVEEGANTSSPLTTSYGYDIGGRLVSVNIGSQSRAFTYDGRGLLTQEQHPELGVNGNGTVSYTEYDSRGHARRKTAGSVDLQTTFDFAERVKQIDDVSVTPSRKLKEFAYTGGRLFAAARFNCDSVLGDIAVTESYQYDDEGRVARRDPSIGSTTNFDGLDFFFFRTYNDLSEIDALNYPCRKTAAGDCNSFDPPRQVSHGYTDGLLSSVSDPAMYASAITYHPNGMLKSVTHGEGSHRVFETWAADPDGMSRPNRIAATNTAGAELWSTGNYAYDGAGNIKTMGQTSYRYDAFQRLLQSMTVTPLGKSTMTDYGYDSFGNRLYETGRTCTAANGRITCGSPTYVARSVTGTTNHYADATYDAAGNVTIDRGRTFSYDPLGMMTRAQMVGRDFHYLYTADDERIAVVERIIAKNKTTWSVRDFDNRVLRLWTDDKTSGTRVITWKEDPIYRDGALLANVSPTGTKHYSLDHLGSPRLVTEETGVVKGLQSFSDYGVGGTTDGGALQYTGHERDMSTFGSGTADLPDYFHARFYDFASGRFMSMDPILGDLTQPQSWNRYAYVRNNPIAYTDPDGREINLSGITNTVDRDLLIQELRTRTGLDLYYDQGLLKSKGALTDANGKPLGSASARKEIEDALAPGTVFTARGFNASSGIDIAGSTGNTILMDFTDIGAITLGNNPPGTVNAAAIFLHELRHSDGGQNLDDPSALELKMNPGLIGANVRKDNQINKELGLPQRNQYRDMTDSQGRRYWSFTSGPVYLPAK